MGKFKEHDIATYHRAFSRYEHLRYKMNGLEANRSHGSFGIAVHDDANAKKWQSLRYRLEVLQSFLRGHKAPNPSFASWLTKEEYERLWREYCDIFSS